MWRQCQEMYYISVVLITDVIDPSIVFLANTLWRNLSMIQDTYNYRYIRFQKDKKLEQIKRYFHIFHTQEYISYKKNNYFCLLFVIYFLIFISIVIKRYIQKKKFFNKTNEINASIIETIYWYRFINKFLVRMKIYRHINK